MSHTPPTPAPTRPSPRGVLGGSAWRLGRIADIEIAVDSSWLLIFGLITYSVHGQLGAEHPDWSAPTGWTAAVATSLLFFASIILHELGHSLTAQRLGVRVHSITLFIFGGVAQLVREPDRPRDEIAIAVAGPAVSAALGLGFGLLAPLLAPVSGAGEPLAAACAWLSRINYSLAIFNLLPGYPLDGGRVFRGAVWAFTGNAARATRTAAASGRGLAYLMIALGVASAVLLRQMVGGVWLVLLGWFLLSAARGAVNQARVEGLLADLDVLDAMQPIADARVTGNESVAALLSAFVHRPRTRCYYVVDPRDGLRGMVTPGALAAVPRDVQATTPVAAVMLPRREGPEISRDASAWDALRAMSESGVDQLPVLDGDRLVGAVTHEGLLLLARRALTQAAAAGRGAQRRP